MMDLQTTFATLCALYFPRWRAAATWTVREGPKATWTEGTAQYGTTEQGYCDKDTRTIFIQNPVPAVLVHEICHAVTDGWHGVHFQRRLALAHQRAVALKDADLAAGLANDLRDCALPGLPQSAPSVYGRVEDILLDAPAVTLDRIVTSFANDFALTPDEVLRRYPRLPYWYARHRRAAAELARGQLYAITTYGCGTADQRKDWEDRLAALTR
jgi:hypothetical protein